MSSNLGRVWRNHPRVPICFEPKAKPPPSFLARVLWACAFWGAFLLLLAWMAAGAGA